MNIKAKLIIIFLMTASCLNSTYAETQLVQESEINNKENSNFQKEPIPFKNLYNRIYTSKASLEHVKQALRSDNPTNLVNVMHALYAMRLDSSVYNLMYDMWELNDIESINVNWKKISEPPVRIALASTINRIDGIKSRALREYIRSFKKANDEKIRGQVLVALGLNGDPIDIPYIEKMANSDNRYLTQIGISSLAFMGTGAAKRVLIKLANQYHDTPRGKLIIDVLKNAYNVVPTTAARTSSID